MPRINIIDIEDGVTYNLNFSKKDADRASIDWGKQKVDLPSIGGSIQITNGQATIMYKNGNRGVGQITCDHQKLIDDLANK